MEQAQAIELLFALLIGTGLAAVVYAVVQWKKNNSGEPSGGGSKKDEGEDLR